MPTKEALRDVGAAEPPLDPVQTFVTQLTTTWTTTGQDLRSRVPATAEFVQTDHGDLGQGREASAAADVC